MAKLTLQGCKHPILKTWGASYPPTDAPRPVTCMVCYERLMITEETVLAARQRLARGTGANDDNSELPHASPALPCQHANKVPLSKPARFTQVAYTDALCEDCGVVVRHPDGPGHWEEVIFNGYVIREEP